MWLKWCKSMYIYRYTYIAGTRPGSCKCGWLLTWWLPLWTRSRTVVWVEFHFFRCFFSVLMCQTPWSTWTSQQWCSPTNLGLVQTMSKSLSLHRTWLIGSIFRDIPSVSDRTKSMFCWLAAVENAELNGCGSVKKWAWLFDLKIEAAPSSVDLFWTHCYFDPFYYYECTWGQTLQSQITLFQRALEISSTFWPGGFGSFSLFYWALIIYLLCWFSLPVTLSLFLSLIDIY